MKIFQVVVFAIMFIVVGVLLPAAMVFSLIQLLIDKPDSFLMLALYCAALSAVVYAIYLLLNNPKTELPTKIVLSIIVAIVVVKSFNTYSDSGCAPSTYIDCD